MNERVYSKDKSIHARMKQMNRKTFANTASDVQGGKDLKLKVAEMEQEPLKSVLDLVERSDIIDLANMLEHHVADEYVSIFNCNGPYKKTPKASSSSA